jgi:hypothetical protein
MRTHASVAIALFVLAGCVEVPPPGGGNPPDGPPGSFPPVADFAERGPFETIVEDSPADCEIYRPAVLGEAGRRHPVIIWGNGTTAWPAIYEGGLDHWASHGFIVAAANTSNAGTGEEMLDCLDWVYAENDRAGSPYEGNVDLEGAGSSGHSQGGGGCIMTGRDPRVTVTAPLQPYVLLFGHEPESQSEQNGPMFLASGGKDAIATIEANQIDVFEAANVPVFWATDDDADHFAPMGDMDDYRGPITAWFRLHLMGDETARDLFYGPSCELCGEDGWTIERKYID